MNAIGLPDETRPGQVRLRTSRLERALDFYERVIGLSVTAANGPVAALSTVGQARPFLVLEEDPRAAPHPHRATGLYHFAIIYPGRPELARAVRRLARHGHPIQGAADHIVSEAIYLADPDGNGVELYADRPRSQWSWRGGQVTMATEALDMDDLLATASRAPGTLDTPPTASLGHIHLHVADLAEAERFYHGYFGLAVTQRTYPGALFMSAGGYHHHLAVNTWAGTAAPPPESVGLISYRFEVPDSKLLKDLSQRVAGAGFETRFFPDQPGSEILRIRDPSGNWLEVEAP
jgi:catechol 2,3-dioxygenase